MRIQFIITHALGKLPWWPSLRVQWTAICIKHCSHICPAIRVKKCYRTCKISCGGILDWHLKTGIGETNKVEYQLVIGCKMERLILIISFLVHQAVWFIQFFSKRILILFYEYPYSLLCWESKDRSNWLWRNVQDAPFCHRNELKCEANNKKYLSWAFPIRTGGITCPIFCLNKQHDL